MDTTTVVSLSVLALIYSGIFGLVVGSFLNVCIYRIPEGKTVVKGHSMCMSCQNTLKARDLVPVFSWLFLRGKCRYCGAPVSSRYAKIEILTALVYFVIFATYVYQMFIVKTINMSLFGLLEVLIIFILASILIVIMMIQYDKKDVAKSVPIIVIILGVLRQIFIFFQTYNFENIIVSLVWGIGIAYFSVIASTLLAKSVQPHSRWTSILKLDGFRFYFLPQNRMIRLMDVLLVSLGFVFGYPAIIPAAVLYLLARVFIINDEKRRYILILVSLGICIGYVLTQMSVFPIY